MRTRAMLVTLAAAACSDPQLHERITALETRTAALEKQNMELEALASKDGMAMVSTTEPGYGIAKSNLVPFTIAVEKTIPYLAGFKVTLRIGNTSAVTFEGAKIKIRWRPTAQPPGFKADEPPEKEIRITNKLHPGSFSTTDVVLSPVKSEDIKFLWIGIETDKMLLRK